MPDAEVLDIFGRLNSYSVTLNEQEKINANHFGPFKTLADRVAHSFNDFWIENGILTDKQILRMADVNLAADLLIAMIDGIKSKKQIRNYYSQFEKEFDPDPELLEERFRETIGTIQGIFNGNLKQSEFSRIHIFYSLFTAIYHLSFGMTGIDRPTMVLSPTQYPRLSVQLDKINSIFASAGSEELSREEGRFLEDSRRATTDKPVRERRTKYLIDLMLS